MSVHSLKKRKVLLIAGLGHSGSTILDLSLGCNPKIIGLGETTHLVRARADNFNDRRFTSTICSCGHDMSHCNFWSAANPILSKYSSKETTSRYSELANYFFDKYGEDKILVDSSKRIDPHMILLREQFDLLVLFIVRDYRSWIYSRHSRHGTNHFRLAYSWFKGNIRINKTLQKGKFNFITIGYEEFSLYPELILNKICEFLQVEYDPLMLTPGKSKSHIIRGNVARGDNDKKKGIYYDARWLTSSKMSLYGPLFIPLIRWNIKNVYSNIIVGNSHAFGVAQKDFVLFGDKKKEKMLSMLKEE